MASLDDYPEDEMMIDKQRHLIGSPATLDMWYPDIRVTDTTAGTQHIYRTGILLDIQ